MKEFQHSLVNPSRLDLQELFLNISSIIKTKFTAIESLTIKDQDSILNHSQGVIAKSAGTWHDNVPACCYAIIWWEDNADKQLIAEALYGERTGEKLDAGLLTRYVNNAFDLTTHKFICNRCGITFQCDNLSHFSFNFKDNPFRDFVKDFNEAIVCELCCDLEDYQQCGLNPFGYKSRRIK